MKKLISSSDFWVGLIFLLLGAAVFMEAREFPTSAGRLPLLGSLLLMVLGFALSVQASVITPKSGLDRDLMKALVSGPLFVSVLLLVWVYLAGAGFGFFEVGLPVVIAIVFIMGHRRPLLNAVFSLAIISAAFIAFGVLLGVRFPISVLLGN